MLQIKDTRRTYINVIGPNGNCESTTPFTLFNSTIALDSNNKLFESNSIKMTMDSESVTGSYINAFSRMDSSKYYFFSGYVKNYNIANGCALCVFANGTGSTAQISTYSTSTSWVRVGITFKPSHWGTGATLSGTQLIGHGLVGQYGYYDGLMLIEITSDEYTNLSIDELLRKYSYTETIKTINHSKQMIIL